MTMRIIVQNDDTQRTAVVTEKEYDATTGKVSSQYEHVIGPKGERSFYIHAARQLTVREDPNAIISAKREGAEKGTKG